MNQTTQHFSRCARPSGTEIANSIELYKRTDTSGITIALVCGAIIAVTLVRLWVTV